MIFLNGFLFHVLPEALFSGAGGRAARVSGLARQVLHDVAHPLAGRRHVALSHAAGAPVPGAMLRSCQRQVARYGAMFAIVQGFGPFGGLAVNPAESLVRALAERCGPDIRTEVLPVSLDRVATEVPKLMEEHRPRVWLGVGLAAGRTALSIEAVAVNLADWPASAADADGVSVARAPIAADGPAAHLTTLPVEPILAAWRQAGIPGYLSQSAGSYLCNFSFYTAAQAASRLGLACMTGFLHVPLLPELVTRPQHQPSMSLALQSAGLDLVIEACRPARAGGVYLGGTGEAS